MHCTHCHYCCWRTAHRDHNNDLDCEHITLPCLLCLSLSSSTYQENWMYFRNQTNVKSEQMALYECGSRSFFCIGSTRLIPSAVMFAFFTCFFPLQYWKGGPAERILHFGLHPVLAQQCTSTASIVCAKGCSKLLYFNHSWAGFNVSLSPRSHFDGFHCVFLIDREHTCCQTSWSKRFIGLSQWRQ